MKTRQKYSRRILLAVLLGTSIYTQTAWAMDILIDGNETTTPTSYSGKAYVGVDGTKTTALGSSVNKIWTGASGLSVANPVFGIEVSTGSTVTADGISGGIDIINILGSNYNTGAVGISNAGNLNITSLGSIYANADKGATGIYACGGTTTVGGVNTINAEANTARGVVVSDGTVQVQFTGENSKIVATSTNGKRTNGIEICNFEDGSYVKGMGSIEALSKVAGDDSSDVFAIYAYTEGYPLAGRKFTVEMDGNGGTIIAKGGNGAIAGVLARTSGTIEVTNVKKMDVYGESGIVYGISNRMATTNVSFTDNADVVVTGNSTLAEDGRATVLLHSTCGSVTANFGKSSKLTAKGNGDACGVFIGGVTEGDATINVNGSGTTAERTVFSFANSGRKAGVGFTLDEDSTIVNLKNVEMDVPDGENNAVVVVEHSGDDTAIDGGVTNPILNIENSLLKGAVVVDDRAELNINIDKDSDFHIRQYAGKEKFSGAINNSGKLYFETKAEMTGNLTLQNGSQLHFVIPTGFDKDNDVMLKLAKALTIPNGTGVYVNESLVSLNSGDEIVLVEDAAGIIMADGVTKQRTSDGFTYQDAEISVEDGKQLIYKSVGGGGIVEDGSKAPAEGMAAASAVVNSSADLAFGAGMNNLVSSTADSCFDTFAAASYGKSRYETGSHVDANGYSILAGIGRKVFNSAGNKITAGLFFEYGNSNYDTYNTGYNGEGKSIYKGGGYMMRFDNTCGNYYEGMLHAGKVRNNWSNQNGGYDLEPTYYGGAMTYGHKFMVGENKQFSVYGSYIYTHTGGGNAVLGDLNSKYDFEATNSHRTKLGVRYAISNLMDTSKFRPYVGLVWEHEFSGKTNASVNGIAVEAPSMKGDSGIFELGCNMEAGKWTLGIGGEVFTGKRRGWNGMLKATYNF